MEGALRGSAAPGLRLIETFGWTPEHGFARLAAHLARLEAGAAALGVALAPGAAEAAALRAGRGPAGLRLRLTVGLGGDVAVEAAPLPAPRPAWTAALAAQTLRADDPWLRVKTTRRPAYDAARAALQAGVDEAILLNERGEVCDGTITTVFVDLGAGLVTPPLAAGVLPGVLRAELIAAGAAREAALAPGDLRRGRLYLGNSLRGLIPARMAG